jgi:4-hydroxybenzoate polyprenyltransferase
MFKRFIDCVDGLKISVLSWLAGFVGVVAIRFFLESLSNPSSSGIIAADAATLAHYLIFYLAVAFGLMCIVGYFSKSFLVWKLVLFGLPIIWLSPIIDLLTSGGKGIRMAYLFSTPWNLLKNFLSYFSFAPGITVGIRLEVLFILVAIGFYVWKKVGAIKPTISAVFLSYLMIFSLLAAPGVIYLFTGAGFSGNTSNLAVQNYLQKSIDLSLIPQNALHGTLSTKTYSRMFELGFNKLISQILFLVSLVFLFAWFWRNKKEKTLSVLKNSRPERLIFFSSLLGVGALVAGVGGNFGNFWWPDVLGALCLVISVCSAFIYAVHVNDEEDVEIDEISNASRPIIVGSVSREEMREAGYIWLAISLLSSYVVGYYPFFMNLVFHAAYYIYSANPLRLKRIPILSSFLISIATLSVVMSGFFWVASDKRVSAFPIGLAFGVLVMMTLASNARDIKDVRGDKKAGVLTLPVIFEKSGVKITGAILGLSFLLVPIFFSNYYLYALSLPAGFLAYKFATRKPYKEIYIFFLYFVFLVLCLFLAFMTP